MADRKPPAAHCICAPVSAPALRALTDHAGAGTYKDVHPWHWARRLLDLARERGEALLLFLAAGEPEVFRWWGEIEDIDVAAFRPGTFETRCAFGALRPVHPIFAPLDSIALNPGAERREREALEPVTPHRQFLDAKLLRPYAVCETPAFVYLALEGEAAP